MLGDTTDAQLLAEPIIGWRAWQLDCHGTFRSPDMGTAWPGGQLTWDKVCACTKDGHAAGRLADAKFFRQQAEHCSIPGSKANLIKYAEGFEKLWTNPVCLCGINAYASRELLEMSKYPTEAIAIGMVELTGQVRQYEKGWRGETGRITSVWSTNFSHERSMPAPYTKTPQQHEDFWEQHAQHHEKAVSRAAAAIGATYHGRW